MPKGDNQFGNKNAVGNKGGGRKSTYDPEYAHIAALVCQAGMTDFELCQILQIGETTLARWRHEHPEFADALKSGKEPSDERVERSLFARANGYKYDAVKFHVVEGEVIQTPYVEHVPPDVTACIFWLKNRRRTIWRDRHDDDSGGTVTVRVTGGFVKDQPVEPNGEPPITVAGGIPKDEQK
jgi:hypothetical protein